MPDTWYKVDNVAKVFLATNTRRDPRVFRVSCTLTEPIQPAALDLALRRTARELPHFQVTLHRGLFWHYLESTDKLPVAQQENLPPCAEIYGPDVKNELLYRVSYYNDRINVEMFHALTDGNGGMLFLKILVHNYLQELYPDALADVPRSEGASASDMTQNSFEKFYTGTRSKAEKRQHTYRLHGTKLPYDQVQFFEAHLSAKQVLERARAVGVSLTSYLCAAQLFAIYREMPSLERRRSIAISLPVNLRNYYPSATARNFFNSVRVAYTFDGQEDLATVARAFDARLKFELSDERVHARMDGYEKLEHIPGIKPIPLFVKNRTVSFFTWLESRHVTATFSNMGRIPVHPALRPYIRGFSAFCSCDGLFTTVCSYDDDLVLGTTSAFAGTNVLKNFYRSLAEDGLDITLYATEVYDK